MGRTDLVPLRIDDPWCRGVTSSDGRVQYNKDARGRVYVPRDEAQRLLASGMRDLHTGEMRMAVSTDPFPEQTAAYQAWCAARGPDAPFVGYLTWALHYREEALHVDQAQGD